VSECPVPYLDDPGLGGGKAAEGFALTKAVRVALSLRLSSKFCPAKSCNTKIFIPSLFNIYDSAL
jgi:hypothetical protein